MAFRQLPDIAILRKMVRYEPSTGLLFWLPRESGDFAHRGHSADKFCQKWNEKYSGKRAFANGHGKFKTHLSGWLQGELILAHRVAWAIHFGAVDFGLIDHMDGDGKNNRISNLRVADRMRNAQNARIRSDATSGVSGVNLNIPKRWGKPLWHARIQCGKKRIHLGSFERFDDAVEARRMAEIEYGFGPVHGRERNQRD